MEPTGKIYLDTCEMARAKLEGSRKDKGTPRRFKTASFFSPVNETGNEVVGLTGVDQDEEEEEEDEGVRGVDRGDVEEEEVDGVCGVEANALKTAFNWSGQSQESARLT